MILVRTIIALILLSFSTSASARIEQKTPSVKEPDGAIIFVHGWYGSAEDTFGKAPDTWMSLIATDEAPTQMKVVLSRYDIFTLSYEEHKSGYLSLPDLTTRLIHDVEHHPTLTSYRRIFIISHSTGGILMQALLPQVSNLASKVAGIFFIAVPSQGAEFGLILKLYLHLQKEPILAIEEASPYLSQVRGAWRSFLQERRVQGLSPLVFCAHETKPMTFLDVIKKHIVSEKDAEGNCERRSFPIPEDHIDIVKPRDRSGVYKWVKDNINWTVAQLHNLSEQKRRLEEAKQETETLRATVKETQQKLNEAQEEVRKINPSGRTSERHSDDATIANLTSEVTRLTNQLRDAQEELRKANTKLKDAERAQEIVQPPPAVKGPSQPPPADKRPSVRTTGSGWVARQAFESCSHVRSSCERDPTKISPGICNQRYQQCVGSGCWYTNTQGHVCGLRRQ